MKIQVSQITAYLSFLEEHCGFYVSVHFTSDSLPSIPEDQIRAIMKYNFHKSPRCMAVKKNAHSICVQMQHNYHASCSGGCFCAVCHADICQYIHPIIANGIPIGFASISGQRNVLSNTDEIVYYSIKDIPNELLESVLAPLSFMIAQLYTENTVSAKSEYQQILQYLNEYHTNTTVTELSTYFNRSKSHISHMFKSKCGISISEYCNNLKLEDACRLLLTTNRSVTEVSYDVGFSNPSYFIQLFRQKYGITPFRYRNHCLCRKRP